MQNKFSKRLNEVLGDTTNAEVERLSGMSNELIGLWRRGKGNPTLEKLEPLRKVLKEKFIYVVTGIKDTIEETASDRDVKYTATKIKTVPIVGSVPCGLPVTSWDIDDNKTLKLTDVGHLHEAFILTAKGDSMSPFINNKDLLLCADLPERIKRNGTAVVVSFNSDPETFNANAKLIKWNGRAKEIMLYSINTKYPPEVYPLKEVFKIYKVVRIIRDVN